MSAKRLKHPHNPHKPGINWKSVYSIYSLQVSQNFLADRGWATTRVAMKLFTMRMTLGYILRLPYIGCVWFRKSGHRMKSKVFKAIGRNDKKKKKVKLVFVYTPTAGDLCTPQPLNDAGAPDPNISPILPQDRYYCCSSYLAISEYE